MFRRELFLISSATASFITPFISSAVNIALPAIFKSFNAGMALVNWFANIFLMSMASTILLWGVVADWFGKERVFITGTSPFMLTAFSIPYLSGFTSLLALRFIEGLGAAMISGTAVAVLVSLYPERVGLVIGINTTAVYLGAALGPVLGGFLVDYAGWTSLFLLTGFVAAVSTVLALLSLRFKRVVGSHTSKHYLRLRLLQF